MSLYTLTVDLLLKSGSFERDSGKAARVVQRDMATIQTSMSDAARRGADDVAAGFRHVAFEAIGLSSALIAVKSAIGKADEWTNLNNRLRLVTQGHVQFAAAQADVVRIAAAARQPLGATAELYQRIAMNQEALGLSGRDLARVVETISKTMVISGTSAAGADAALVQLGQAFASGTLRGGELNSVLEQAPALAQAIAKGLNVPIGKLRELGAAGKLSSQQVISALQSQAGAVDEAFGKMTATVGQSLTLFNNNLQVMVGRADEAKLIDQTTIQPDGKPGDDAFTAFATCNDNFQDAEARLVVLEAGGGETGGRLDNEIAARTSADAALGARIDAEHSLITQETADRIAAVLAEATAHVTSDATLSARILGKNMLINGDFRFWQRGTTSPASATRRYVADRWETWSIGSTTQVDAMAINDGSIDPPARFAHRVIVNSVAGNGNFAFFRQHIEGVRTASGRAVTFSVRVYSQVASQLAINIAQNFGIGGSATVNIDAKKFNLVAGWKSITATFLIPSVAGKTIGVSSSLILQVWMDAGSDYNSVTASLGQRSGTYWVANAQLELGAIATDFEYRPDAVEQVLCRYYCRTEKVVENGSARLNLANGFFQNSTTFYALYEYQQMRVPPSIVISPAAAWRILIGNSATGVSAITAAEIANNRFTLIATCPAVTAGMGGQVQTIDSPPAGSGIYLDAEI